MTADPFCSRVDRNISTPLEWSEKVASHAEGIVHHHADTLATSHLDDRLIIRNIECRITKILKEDSLCTAVCKSLEVCNIVTLGKTHLNAHVTKSDCKHRECTSIKEWLSHDIVSRTADIGDRKEYCRLAGSSGHCCDTSLKRSHSLFEYLVGSVCNTSINVSRALQLKKLCAVLHVIKCICC